MVEQIQIGRRTKMSKMHAKPRQKRTSKVRGLARTRRIMEKEKGMTKGKPRALAKEPGQQLTKS